MMYELCEQHGVPFERCGKVIVALDGGELPRLDELERRGIANQVPGLRRIDAGELREIEPHAAGVEALHSPATGIVDFQQVARVLAAELRRRRRRGGDGMCGERRHSGRRTPADRTRARDDRGALRDLLRRRMVRSPRDARRCAGRIHASSRSAGST